jgi:hypothetical protein
MTPQIQKGPIFLSAGVPYEDPNRNPGGRTYSCEAVAVREAVRALVATVVSERALVFGGQPAVTPFVWDAAKSLHGEERVYIYQSELFRPFVPASARFFSKLVWTPAAYLGASPADPAALKSSLEIMRTQMIDTRMIQGGSLLPVYDAAVFIGGMDGVEAEWKLFRQHYPQTPVFPIGSTGGAAALLQGPWQQAQGSISWNGKTPDPADLLNELRYRSLFRKLLRNI